MNSSQSTHQEVALRQRRFAAPGFSTESIVNTIKVIESKEDITTPLLLWDDLPDWRRDNTFIHSGYRQIRPSYLRSFCSLFYLHNESVNIWSHLVGAIIAVTVSLYLYYVIFPRYDSATSSDVLVFACFIGGAVLCLGMSATFHTVLDHSQETARWGNKLDYTGIVALIVGSFVPALYYSFFCKPTLLTAYLCMVSLGFTRRDITRRIMTKSQICLLGTRCAIISWSEQFRTPKWWPYRAIMFIGLGLSGFIPVIHGITIYGYMGLEDRSSVTFVIIQGGMYIFGALFYAVRHSRPNCLTMAMSD